MLQAQHFFNGAAYFFFLRGAAPTSRTAPKVYLPIQNIPEPKFYFRRRHTKFHPQQQKKESLSKPYGKGFLVYGVYSPYRGERGQIPISL